MIHDHTHQEPRTTPQPARAPEPTPAPAPVSSSDDPILQLQQEYGPEGARIRMRSTNHPAELFVTGLVVTCPNCSARRDWMIICDGNRIDIRCRCAHQWHEPEISRADFEAMIDVVPGPVYPSLEDAARATGYDGTFTGMYLNERRPME